ncbi:MAG: response regulator [Candidatus Omnitrophica bacterium]|nr:response regulator [Candidatus Omnitrophota bacterium]
MSEPPKKVLIVDDTMPNRELLKAVLGDTNSDYSLLEADCGGAAIETVGKEMPDIILLDIQMPDIDGYEVCRRLKADKKYRHIPVLFITALTATDEKVKGFECGAEDYITKPINPAEVKARIKAHLNVRETERLKTLQDMITTYNHNMNQPLMVIYTYLDILHSKLSDQDIGYKELAKIKKELDKINDILKKIQTLEKVKTVNYVGGAGMIDLDTK